MRLKAALEVLRCCVSDGGGAKEARGGYPNVQATEAVEDLIDENEGLFLLGNVEGIRNDLGVGAELSQFFNEGLVGRVAGRLVAG